MIFTVDPGLRGCGCAAWTTEGELVSAEYVPGSKEPDASINLVVGVAAHAVLCWMKSTQAMHTIEKIVIERQQTYQGRASRGDTNDLLDVSLVVGCILGELPMATLVRPAEWKGQTPKRVTEARAKDKLSAEERARVHLPGRDKKLASNVWDAIGIGLWHFRR